MSPANPVNPPKPRTRRPPADVTPDLVGRHREALREMNAQLRRLKIGGRATPEDLLRLASLMQRAGRAKDSLKVLKRLLEAKPRHLMGHFLAARAHELTGRPRAAADGYALVERWAPPWGAPRLRKALCLKRMGRDAEARRAMEAYLAREGGDLERRRQLVKDCLRAGEFATALKHLDWVVAACQAEAWDHEARGVALERLGRAGEAVAAYDQARHGPDAARAGLRLARLRMKRGEYLRAWEACETLLARFPGHPGALQTAADAALRLGDVDRSQTAYERLQRLHPEDPDVRVRYAETLIAGGDLNEAARQLRPVVDKHPRNPRAALRLAEIHHKQGERVRARDLYGRVLAIDPGQPLALLRVGELALAEDDPKAAVQPLRRLVLRAPENPAAHRLLGDALRRAKRLADARTHLERALELNPDDHEACLLLGHTLRDQQALAGAEVAYKRVLARASGSAHATRAAYELKHLVPAPATKEPPRQGIVVPLRPRDGDAGRVAPPARWKKTA